MRKWKMLLRREENWRNLFLLYLSNHFRGIVMLHDAKDGFADPSFVSTKFLIERMK